MFFLSKFELSSQACAIAYGAAIYGKGSVQRLRYDGDQGLLLIDNEN